MHNNIKYPKIKETPNWSWLDEFAPYFYVAILFIIVGYTWAYKAYSPQITELKYEISRLETELFNCQIKKDLQNVITR